MSTKFINPEISRRGFVGLSAAAAASTMLAGCSSSSTSSTTETTTSGSIKEGGTFVYCDATSLATKNWYAVQNLNVGIRIFSNVWDFLYIANADGTIDYKLAKDLTISDDGLVYTVTLRDDIKWSDGEPITADDLYWTADLLLNTDAISNSRFDTVGFDGSSCTIEQKSDTVVEFTIPYKTSTFKAALDEFVILPKHDFEGVADAEILTSPVNDTMSTSGPFKVDSLVAGDKVVLSKNENYYGDTGHLDGFEVRFVGESSAQEIAYKNDEISLLEIADTEMLATYQNDENSNIVSYPDTNLTYVEINPNNELTADIEVRKAIVDALNIDEIVAGAAGDELFAQPANCVLNTESWFYDPSIKNYEQNLDEAKKIIEEKGLAGKTVTVIYTSDRTWQERLATMIKSQLDAVGFDCQLQGLETMAFMGTFWMPSTDYNIGFMTNGQTGDPIVFCSLFNGQMCPNIFSSDKLNELWTEFGTEVDYDKRKELMDEALAELKECYSAVPLCNTNYVGAVKKNIGGVEDSERLTDMTKVYFTE